jgi:hypothetical protein
VQIVDREVTFSVRLPAPLNRNSES